MWTWEHIMDRHGGWRVTFCLLGGRGVSIVTRLPLIPCPISYWRVSHLSDSLRPPALGPSPGGDCSQKGVTPASSGPRAPSGAHSGTEVTFGGWFQLQNLPRARGWPCAPEGRSCVKPIVYNMNEENTPPWGWCKNWPLGFPSPSEPNWEGSGSFFWVSSVVWSLNPVPLRWPIPCLSLTTHAFYFIFLI